MLQMCGLTTLELSDIHNTIADILENAWGTGRGRKSKIIAKDAFFLGCVNMKHGDTWGLLEKIFCMKVPVFEKTVVSVIYSTVEILYKECVASIIKKLLMLKLQQYGILFQHFLYVKYATDATFQQSIKPFETIEKTREWSSKKHKLFGYKVEVSVLPNCLALNCSSYERGKVSDNFVPW